MNVIEKQFLSALFNIPVGKVLRWGIRDRQELIQACEVYTGRNYTKLRQIAQLRGSRS